MSSSDHDHEQSGSRGDLWLIESVSAHIERHFGPVDLVWHENVPRDIHVDIHTVAATDERPFHALITSGMAERPMSVDATVVDADYWRFAELMLTLPPDWPMDEERLKQPKYWWPLRALINLA